MPGIELRSIRQSERERVLDLLAEWYGDREFFARYFRHDPSFRDELCFVACDGDRIVSTFQVFRKRIRSAYGTLEVAGVGNVFTTPAYRRRGIAFRLLEYGLRQLPAHGFDVSLLFASRHEFYGALGYHCHTRLLTLITGHCAPAEPGQYRIRPFTAADLPAVCGLYDRYAQSLLATTVRDDAYWRGQLHYAGNPQESFLVATRGDEVVAYARATPLFDLYVIMEHAVAPEHREALAELVAAHHAAGGAQAPATLAHLEHEPQVTARLNQLGLATSRVEDRFCMWRVIDPEVLSRKLGGAEKVSAAEELWARLFPPERSVYWIADRF